MYQFVADYVSGLDKPPLYTDDILDAVENIFEDAIHAEFPEVITQEIDFSVDLDGDNKIYISAAFEDFSEREEADYPFILVRITEKLIPDYSFSRGFIRWGNEKVLIEINQ